MPNFYQSAADYDTFGVKNTFYRVNDRAQVGYKNFDCLAAFFVAVCGFFENSVAVEAAAVKLACRSHKPGSRNILFGAADLAAWRRQNVTALVAKVHRTVKAADPTLRFGISPQGNPDNDLDQQYSDVTAWLAAGGEEKVIDYLCPQVYWGYGFTLHSGSTRFAFENIVPAWLSYPRAGDVALYFGLGAYRVGTGDGGANPDSVSGWSTGSALAAQVKDLRQQAAGGWALYRYGSLFGAEAPALAEAECAALRALNK